MTRRKQPKPNLRHQHDYDHWFSATPVTERQEVETLWGVATAEVGTFILTDGDSQVVCTQSDLDQMTTDPSPPPSAAGPSVMVPAPAYNPFPPHLPGRRDDDEIAPPSES